MGVDEADSGAPVRQAWREGPDPGAEGLLALTDDELLHAIESLPEEHGMDESLLSVVCSNRHFFIRQAAAKRIRDAGLLFAHAHDRHVGQILARRMSRIEDIAYLEHLLATSHYLEVRKAAHAQLALLHKRLSKRTDRS
jgi:hypothetical protein